MLSLSPTTQMDGNGSALMPKKDSPFLLKIAGWMAFLAQSTTTMK
jgi:hypothetical protein